MTVTSCVTSDAMTQTYRRFARYSFALIKRRIISQETRIIRAIWRNRCPDPRTIWKPLPTVLLFGAVAHDSRLGLLVQSHIDYARGVSSDGGSVCWAVRDGDSPVRSKSVLPSRCGCMHAASRLNALTDAPVAPTSGMRSKQHRLLAYTSKISRKHGGGQLITVHDSSESRCRRPAER